MMVPLKLCIAEKVDSSVILESKENKSLGIIVLNIQGMDGNYDN